jgi:hypothetical protein
MPRYDNESRLLSNFIRKNRETLTVKDKAWLLYNFFKDRLIYASVDIPKIIKKNLVEVNMLTNIRDYIITVNKRYAETSKDKTNELISVFYSDHDYGTLSLRQTKFYPKGLPKVLMPIPSATYFGLLSELEHAYAFYNINAPKSQITIHKELINNVYQMFLDHSEFNPARSGLFSKPTKCPPEPITLEDALKQLELEPPELRFPHEEIDPYYANQLIIYWATRFDSESLPRWINNYTLFLIQRCKFNYNITSRLHHNLVYADPAVFPPPALDEKLIGNYANKSDLWQVLQLPMEYRFDIEVPMEFRFKPSQPKADPLVLKDQAPLVDSQESAQDWATESQEALQSLPEEAQEDAQDLAAESQEAAQSLPEESQEGAQDLAAESEEADQSLSEESEDPVQALAAEYEAAQSLAMESQDMAQDLAAEYEAALSASDQSQEASQSLSEESQEGAQDLAAEFQAVSQSLAKESQDTSDLAAEFQAVSQSLSEKTQDSAKDLPAEYEPSAKCYSEEIQNTTHYLAVKSVDTTPILSEESHLANQFSGIEWRNIGQVQNTRKMMTDDKHLMTMLNGARALEIDPEKIDQDRATLLVDIDNNPSLNEKAKTRAKSKNMKDFLTGFTDQLKNGTLRLSIKAIGKKQLSDSSENEQIVDVTELITGQRNDSEDTTQIVLPPFEFLMPDLGVQSEYKFNEDSVGELARLIDFDLVTDSEDEAEEYDDSDLDEDSEDDSEEYDDSDLDEDSEDEDSQPSLLAERPEVFIAQTRGPSAKDHDSGADETTSEDVIQPSDSVTISRKKYNSILRLFLFKNKLAARNRQLLIKLDTLEDDYDDLEKDFNKAEEELREAIKDRDKAKKERQDDYDKLVALSLQNIEYERLIKPNQEQIEKQETEIAELKQKNYNYSVELAKSTEMLQQALQDPNAHYLENLELRKQLEDANNTASNLMTNLSKRNDAYNEVAIKNQEMNREVYALKNDLENSSEWIYPETLTDVVRAGKKYYGSKLIFHERVYQSISAFSAAQSEKKYRLISEAVKMIKHLATTMHKLKFEDNNLSEDAFTNTTGIRFSMTERKITKNEKQIEKSRTLKYNGETITFYPHLKSTVQGTELRVHFQFLENEKKILICHLGDHLPTAGTRQKS